MVDTTRRRLLDHARRTFIAAPLLAMDLGQAQAQPSAGEASHTTARAGGRVSAEAFGAVGDGTTDDRAAIQSAIDSLKNNGGGVLLLANKSYRIDGGIEVDPTSVSISGTHAVLDCRHLPAGTAAITVRSMRGGPQYGHATQFIEGIIIEGQGRNSEVTGIALRTDVPLLSTRVALRNLVIRNVGNGLDFGARAYLCQCYSLQIYSTRTAVVFTSNEDAGENVSFYGCSFFNSDLAVENRSGAFANFFGCSFDYCGKWFLGTGMNQFSNCWFEKHRPTEADDYPFDLISGEMTFFGGGIQISGIELEKGNQNRYMFMIRDRMARVILNGTSAWNWRTASDELAGGAGSITIRGLGGSGRKLMPTVLKNDGQHNVFGASGQFKDDAIRLPCWIQAEGAERVNARELAWRNGASTYARSFMSIISDPAREDRRCLRIRKGIGQGTPFSFNIASPISPGEGFAFRLSHRLGAGPAGPFWVQILFAQALGTDEFGMPRFGNQQFWGESAVLPRDGDSDWRRIIFNSHNLDETSNALGFAPAWATHVNLHINLVSLAADAELWIADVGGWRL